MQQADDHIEDEARCKQHCGEAKRLAVDHETPSLSDLGAFVAQGVYRRGRRSSARWCGLGAGSMHTLTRRHLSLPFGPSIPALAAANH
jgi:hypothetical protein